MLILSLADDLITILPENKHRERWLLSYAKLLDSHISAEMQDNQLSVNDFLMLAHKV
jgi:hypothetical protein